MLRARQICSTSLMIRRHKKRRALQPSAFFVPRKNILRKFNFPVDFAQILMYHTSVSKS